MIASRRSVLSFALASLLLATTVLFAQYRVNNQIYGNTGPSAASMRYTPQYMGGQQNVPSSARMMPSEARNAYYKSGSLPSDVRMQYARVGPLAPGGVQAYIPPPQNPRPNASAMPTGNYMNTQVTGQNNYVSPGGGVGSVRYSSSLSTPTFAAAPSKSVAPAPMSGAPMSGAVGSNTLQYSGPSMGSIRFAQ